ncbi:hypothetical protein BCIN_14g01130 [Botrytis cinerea B05.10]|uniref:RING-type domain-containing protein n=2 Tax=Botryotinia fuckeliana TaxID=40559 RepID=A0A384K2P5_BOTFB|nr:hypothetical protein BCIN_14g01130 [Botrytis cinerea B05.10]ATZ56904.1 hypothetical protein BCIN_14g01130 [Botrytis cinerea B05.10]CCD33664.1 hypothetical protein BofuT4_P068100.1 [Botrytis cinerea T4]
MPYRPRLPQIIDLLRQEDRYDEPRFQTDFQRYFTEIRAKFGNSLSLERQEELLKCFVFSINFGHGCRFPGDIGLNPLPVLPDPAHGDFPPHFSSSNCVLSGNPRNSPFATVFLEMQARERRLCRSAAHIIPMNSLPHSHYNSVRGNGRIDVSFALAPATLLSQNDDSSNSNGSGGSSPDDNGPDDNGPDDNGPDDNGPDDNGPDDNGPDDNGSGDSGPYDNGPYDNGSDDDVPTAEILAANPEQEDDDICPICRESFSDTKPSASLIPNCGHFFHLGCMVQWINSNLNGGRLRDRCIHCRRGFDRIFSQSHGEVTPPQNGEDFWRNDDGPLINEVFPRLENHSSPFIELNMPGINTPTFLELDITGMDTPTVLEFEVTGIDTPTFLALEITQIID